MKWVEREDGNMDLLAVGSEKGKLRREVIATLYVDLEKVGGSADPTGPLQERVKKREFPGGVVKMTKDEEEEEEARPDTEANGKAEGSGEAQPPPPAYVEKAPGERGGEEINGESGLEPALAAAKISGAVDVVPQDAVATPLPGEQNGRARE